MDSVFQRRPVLQIALLFGLLVTQGVCRDKNDLVQADAVLTWQSPRMRAIEHEYDDLWESDSRRQRENPSEGKRIYGETRLACQRLFQSRLSYQDLRQLAQLCNALPPRFQDRQAGFNADMLEFMFKYFAAVGDRDALVTLLSTRFLDIIGWTQRIEFYLVRQESLSHDFRGNRLKDSILILGEAFSKCEIPDVRHEIAVAIRRAFAGLGMDGKDDAEFVTNAMQWYREEKEHLALNHKYSHGEITPLSVESAISDSATTRPPLFIKTNSKPGGMRFLAMLPIWLIHAGIALILSAPILFFGRRRVRWQPWELLVVILPFAVWLLLMVSQFSVGRKSLGNLVEPVYLALGVPIVAALRCAIGARVPQFLCAAVLILLLCVGAIALFFVVPPSVVMN